MTLVPELRTELEAAARRHVARGATRRPRWLHAGRGSALLVSAVAAACTIIVLLVGASGSTAPAYALARQADGTFTLKLYTLSRDIPQLNAKLRALGIDETVVPIVDGCPHLAPAYPVSAQETITLRPGHYDLAPGEQGFIAARELGDGRVGLAQGAMPKTDIPPCFGTTPATVIPEAGSAPRTH